MATKIPELDIAASSCRSWVLNAYHRQHTLTKTYVNDIQDWTDVKAVLLLKHFSCFRLKPFVVSRSCNWMLLTETQTQKGEHGMFWFSILQYIGLKRLPWVTVWNTYLQRYLHVAVSFSLHNSCECKAGSVFHSQINFVLFWLNRYG